MRCVLKFVIWIVTLCSSVKSTDIQENALSFEAFYIPCYGKQNLGNFRNCISPLRYTRMYMRDIDWRAFHLKWTRSETFWRLSSVIHIRNEIILTSGITGFIAARVTVQPPTQPWNIKPAKSFFCLHLTHSLSLSYFPQLPINFSLVWKLPHPTETPHHIPSSLHSPGHFKSNFFLFSSFFLPFRLHSLPWKPFLHFSSLRSFISPFWILCRNNHDPLASYQYLYYNHIHFIWFLLWKSLLYICRNSLARLF
jgi:hypothetical protein